MLVALVTVLVPISSPVKGCLVYGYSSDNLHHPSSCICAVLAMLSHSKLTFSSPQTWESFRLFLQPYQKQLSELTQSLAISNSVLLTYFPGFHKCIPNVVNTCGNKN